MGPGEKAMDLFDRPATEKNMNRTFGEMHVTTECDVHHFHSNDNTYQSQKLTQNSMDGIQLAYFKLVAV